MTAIAATTGTIRSRVDGTLVLTIEFEPSQAQGAFRLFATPGTQVAITALRDGSFLEQKNCAPEQPEPDELPVQPEPEKAPREPLGDACYRSVMWCKDATFWHWITSLQIDFFGTCKSEREATLFVKTTCGVESHKDLDIDNEANKAWNRLIREPYRKWLSTLN